MVEQMPGGKTSATKKFQNPIGKTYVKSYVEEKL